jgi:cobalt-zinc-cadmium efflux system outer membrane protein
VRPFIVGRWAAIAALAAAVSTAPVALSAELPNPAAPDATAADPGAAARRLGYNAAPPSGGENQPAIATDAPDAGAGAQPTSPSGATVSALDLRTALEQTLRYQPQLIALRQNLAVSAEAIEVARRFPTSLNPSVSVTIEPWTFVRGPSGVEPLESLFNVTWLQPIEFGHRRQLRQAMAEASYTQTRWNIVQAELAALVQTYRSHQTALYRRQKLAVAQRLMDLNQRLIGVLGRQMEANRVAASDVVLAQAEGRAIAQQQETARQEYLAALADLRRQIGMIELAESAEPAGEFTVPSGPEGTRVPADEPALVRMALDCRPEVQAAAAQLAVSRAAVALARAERIPIPSLGPTYERDEAGISYYGFALSTPLPLVNSGKPLVRQREAEEHRDLVAWQQAQQQVRVQVRVALARWRQSQESVARTRACCAPVAAQAERMQRLYEAGQADLVKLFQLWQRLIESENAQLDSIWMATQAYAELLTAIGVTPMLAGLGQAE